MLLALLPYSCWPPCRDELALEHPFVLVRVERFAAPMKIVAADFRERPSRLGSVGPRPILENVRAVPAADLFLAVAAHRIGPRDAPHLRRRIPRAQRRAEHVHAAVDVAR